MDRWEARIKNALAEEEWEDFHRRQSEQQKEEATKLLSAAKQRELEQRRIRRENARRCRRAKFEACLLAARARITEEARCAIYCPLPRGSLREASKRPCPDEASALAPSEGAAPKERYKPLFVGYSCGGTAERRRKRQAKHSTSVQLSAQKVLRNAGVGGSSREVSGRSAWSIFLWLLAGVVFGLQLESTPEGRRCVRRSRVVGGVRRCHPRSSSGCGVHGGARGARGQLERSVRARWWQRLFGMSRAQLSMSVNVSRRALEIVSKESGAPS